MDLHAQMLYDDFLEMKPSLEVLKKIGDGMIQGIIRDNGLYVVAVESRLKADSSLAGKLELKGKKYKKITDITDLLGMRIVMFYSHEVDRVSALVESCFNVDWENSVDKRKMYSAANNDRFGYMSLHYIVSIPKEKYFDPEHPEINELRFEIQLRTALQHVWATAYHDTGYKSDVQVPPKYLRKMSQLAGLLEIADTSFTNILAEITEYRRNVQSLVSNGDFSSLALDGDTFKSYMDIDPFRDLNEKISGINNCEFVPTSYDSYLDFFKHVGFETIGDIEEMKNKYSEMAYHLALEQLAGTDIDILASTVGLQKLCLCWIYDQGTGVFGLKEFFDITSGPSDSNVRTAERSMKHLEQIHVL